MLAAFDTCLEKDLGDNVYLIPKKENYQHKRSSAPRLMQSNVHSFVMAFLPISPSANERFKAGANLIKSIPFMLQTSEFGRSDALSELKVDEIAAR